MNGYTVFIDTEQTHGGDSTCICAGAAGCYRNATEAMTGRVSSNRVSISERPSEAATRERIGDWEGDTVHARAVTWSRGGAYSGPIVTAHSVCQRDPACSGLT